MRLLACLLLALASPVATRAESVMTVTGGWVRPAQRGGVTAGYFTLLNRGSRADRLTAASSRAAADVTLHESRTLAGMATMRRLNSVTVPAGATVAFAPGGMHLMIGGLARDLRAGATVLITLQFAHERPATAAFRVRSTPP